MVIDLGVHQANASTHNPSNTRLPLFFGKLQLWFMCKSAGKWRLAVQPTARISRLTGHDGQTMTSFGQTWTINRTFSKDSMHSTGSGGVVTTVDNSLRPPLRCHFA
jgi:hypothetical protein